MCKIYYAAFYIPTFWFGESNNWFKEGERLIVGGENYELDRLDLVLNKVNEKTADVRAKEKG